MVEARRSTGASTDTRPRESVVAPELSAAYDGFMDTTINSQTLYIGELNRLDAESLRLPEGILANFNEAIAARFSDTATLEVRGEIDHSYRTRGHQALTELAAQVVKLIHMAWDEFSVDLRAHLDLSRSVLPLVVFTEGADKLKAQITSAGGSLKRYAGLLDLPYITTSHLLDLERALNEAFAWENARLDAHATDPSRKDDWLPKARTEQAFADRQTIGWMNDSGFWGVSYPISGDTLSALKEAEAKKVTAPKFTPQG